jgi:tetratricopeptide (TPR) repeat protein
MTAPVKLPASGTLAQQPLPRILLALYAARFTGRLQLSRARTQKTFVLQDGALVGSESNLPAEYLGAVLEDAGVLGRADRERVNEYVRDRKCQEGVALLSLALVDPKQLFEGLREQVRRRAIECFGWADGDYCLEPTEERKEDVQPFRADPYRVVQEGLQNHWSAERMLEALGAHLNHYARPGARLGKVMRRLALDATVERMLASLTGQKTLGEVISTIVRAPSALAAFWVLDAAGALSYSETKHGGPGEETAREIEIQVTGASATAEDAPARLQVGRSSAKAATGQGAEADKMRREVLDRLERLDEIDYYELLGIARDAPHAAIRKAYFLAAKRYHPDAIARLGLQDIRVQAGEVFSRIAEANEVLSDRDRRRAYDGALEGGVAEIDVQTLAQAETFYRKGEILINMGDFRGALPYLKNAVTLYPDEAIYQSDLAWAYYKKSPPEPELALEHIRRALALDAGNAEAQFRLGVIERARR